MQTEELVSGGRGNNKHVHVGRRKTCVLDAMLAIMVSVVVTRSKKEMHFTLYLTFSSTFI